MPGLISFSGGRSSAYMLRLMLDQHGGSLPNDMIVSFANTGREREETLRFVHECGSRWGVRVRWIEWRDSAEGFEEVGFNSASRNGEPFAALIAKKKRLPNWQERWCTSFLKIKPMHALMRAELGLDPGEYEEFVGLRRDEAGRIGDAVEGDAKTGRRRSFPLSRSCVTKPMVLDFWDKQPFNLELEPWEGNCDLCFATGRGIRIARLRRHPSCGQWWAEQEAAIDGTFDRRDSVVDLMREVAATPTLFDTPSGDYDVECGLHCAGAEFDQ